MGRGTAHAMLERTAICYLHRPGEHTIAIATFLVSIHLCVYHGHNLKETENDIAEYIPWWLPETLSVTCTALMV